ncbi:MAG: lamin tail domain-containing protein [Candidatus Micrarchaeia archaeon]
MNARAGLFSVASLAILFLGCLAQPPAQNITANITPQNATPPANLTPAPPINITLPSPPAPANITPHPPARPAPPAGNLTFHFIDVGQGDAIFVVLPNNKSFLVDAGPSKAKSKLIDYLLLHGGERLSFTLATHPDADHIGGMKEVIANFPSLLHYFNGQLKQTITFAELTAFLDRRGIPVRTVRAGDVLVNESGVSVLVLNPPQPAPQHIPDAETNRYSIVLKVSYGDVCALLAGDVDEAGELAILQGGFQITCQILKVAHHGSASSSSDAFLIAVQPKIAVISVGANNSYGHPHEQTLRRLAGLNASIYRTDLQGTIVITTDGSTFAVYPERPLPNASAAPPSPSSSCIRLALAHYDAAGNDLTNLNDEYIVFENVCDRNIELAGWRLEDAAGNRYSFPPYLLLAHSTLSIHSGCGEDNTPNIYWCSPNPIWNNDGDVIYLFDKDGALALRYAYGAAS